LLSGRWSRGRHGNALQWHLGLSPHDSAAELDWEDRIEIKLVSVWLRSDGSVACDKLKVCDAGVDPGTKLSNVLFVFADRVSRVVVGYRFFNLAGSSRERLAAAWGVDPHFGEPPLFIEARGKGEAQNPAYYLSARWFQEQSLLVGADGVFPFDAAAWSKARQGHDGRDPLLTAMDAGTPSVVCPRCGGAIEADTSALERLGWALAKHRMPIDGPCALAGHWAVDAGRLPRSNRCSRTELVAGVQRAVPKGSVWRLADRVIEPADHLH
jgi:hypothetical protein